MIILLILALVLSGCSIGEKLEKSKEVNIGQQSVDKYFVSTATASTSPIYKLSTSASSTIVMSTKNIDYIDLNVQLTSSSTLPDFYWTCSFSEDGIDWYGESGYTETSDNLITYGSNSRLHYWDAPATTSVGQILMKNFTNACGAEAAYSPIMAQYTKITMAVREASASLYVEAKTRQISY